MNTHSAVHCKGARNQIRVTENTLCSRESFGDDIGDSHLQFWVIDLQERASTKSV